MIGGFITRLGIGGMPFLLPLLYQLGLGFPAWKSGMLMMPAALAAMGMKFISVRVLRRFGYRRVLIMNTFLIGLTISGYSLVTPATPLIFMIFCGFCQGFFNSLQFSSMNSMAYADIDSKESSMASTIASSFQQLSLSFGLAFGSIVAAWFLGAVPQSNQPAIIDALHHAFLALGAITVFSALAFTALRTDDGESISGSKTAITQAQTIPPSA